jgi:hypothetical protein
MGLTNVKRPLVIAAPSCTPSVPSTVVRRAAVPPPPAAVILKHCRCVDCLNLAESGEEYVCSEDIGGTKVVWATGRRVCELAPDAWHYCAGYDGPQISKDVWVWREA